MDHDTVATMHNKKVKIRPIAKTIELTGQVSPAIDDCWRIGNLSREKFRLVNCRTNHGLMLSVGDIEQFKCDPQGGAHGFLYLRGQVVLKGSGVCVETQNSPAAA